MDKRMPIKLREHGTYYQRSGHVVGPVHLDRDMGEFCFYADNERSPRLMVEVWDENGNSIFNDPRDDIVAEWRPDMRGSL